MLNGRNYLFAHVMDKAKRSLRLFMKEAAGKLNNGCSYLDRCEGGFSKEVDN